MFIDGIIAKVQQSDLSAAEERLKSERDQRRTLRSQHGSSGMSASELLVKLSGASEDKTDAPMDVTSEETQHARQRSGGFPSPPSGPGVAASVQR